MLFGVVADLEVRVPVFFGKAPQRIQFVDFGTARVRIEKWCEAVMRLYA
jgi:hypothetical protein